MIRKASIPLTVKQLHKMIGKETVSFDNEVQRGLTWDDKKKSLFIHSLMTGYPVPPLYAVKNEKGYDMLDGKQRSNAVESFLNGEFALKDVPSVVLEDGQDLDLNMSFFDDLNEELKDAINSYSLTMYYFDGITDDEISEMFYRLNNGKPLTAIELTRVRSKSLKDIKEIASHRLFTTILTDSSINKYTNEDIVIKTMIMLTIDNPCLDTKYVRPFTENLVLSDEDKAMLNSVFDKFLDVYECIYNKSIADKMKKDILKKIVRTTHLLSVIPFIKKSVDENIDSELIARWLINFYGTGNRRKTSVSDEYNANCRSGVGHEASVNNRFKALTESFDSFAEETMKAISEIKNTETETETETEIKTEIKTDVETDVNTEIETEKVEMVTEEVNAD